MPPEYISKRQLQHWINKGYLEAPKDRRPGNHGTWTPEGVSKARAIWKLRDSGFELARAAELADWVIGGDPFDFITGHALVPGVTLLVDFLEFFRDD